MTLEQRLHAALQSPEATRALQALVADLFREGYTRKTVCQLLLDLTDQIRSWPDYHERMEEALVDISDALTGWCHPNAWLHDRERPQKQQRWLDLWKKVVRAAGQENAWQPPRLNEGGALFSTVDENRQIGVRVFEPDLTSDKPHPDLWVNPSGGGPPGKVRELVVSGELSERTEAEVFRALFDWVTQSG